MKQNLVAMLLCLAAVVGCNEDKIIMTESGPPFAASWSGTYVDTTNVSRPLQLSLKIDSSNNISGTYTMDFVDTLGVLIVVNGAATGQATSDTSGTLFLNNDAFRWRLSGSISPPFRFSGGWLALSPPGGGLGNFSVTK